MSAVPVPMAPAHRFIPAVQSVTERLGVTVAVDRQPNLCRWAVHTTDTAGRDIMVTGPSRGDAANPSNRELAAQITTAVDSLGVEVGQVFTSDWPTATLLRAKTALPVTDLSAPPASLVKARNGIAAVERRAVSGLVLACDASRGKGRSINGCGWVLAYANGADPVVGAYTTVSEHGGIRAGELAAIRRGLQATLNLHPVLRDGTGSLTVLSDSKSALDLLARVTADEDVSGEDGDSVQECRRILGSARGADIRFEWVRGHDGHPLNEIADRLAVLARRNREMGVDDITGHRMLAGVREDAKVICAAL
ncbi:RNase H family protein [Pseudarthrobacter sp. BIM B-2242]|uniref:RNase H family protein n=1 Tax=Pseudarthrobacter sp. BIM B-2242 TaxID=2772401 RepID=UPI00168B2748|nr:RNase H family protein [Pseudarthrobacter sp. BIM B-2242]QOD05706.1 ribonuclease H [Pseudarthrobacter sp. BIM B-2242]